MKAYKRLGRSDYVSMSDVGVPFFGNDESEVVFTMYANPMSETCSVLLGEKWDVIERDFLQEGDGGVGFQIVMVAPEMQSWASRLSFDSVRGVKSVVGRGSVSATDVSEAGFAVYDLYGDGVFIEFLQKVFAVPVDELSFARLEELVDESGGDGGVVMRAVERGTYEKAVREMTEEWLDVVPVEYVDSVNDSVVFINGFVIPDCDVDALRRNVLAGRKLMGEELVLDEETREKLIGDSAFSVSDFR